MSVTDDALWAAMDAYLDSDPEDATVSRERMRAALTAAREHYTADDLRNTPAGRALMAEGKSLGWDDAIGELRKGQGMHRALAGTLATRKPIYKETPNE